MSPFMHGGHYYLRDGRKVEYLGRTPDGRFEVIHLHELDIDGKIEEWPGATLFVDEICTNPGDQYSVSA